MSRRWLSERRRDPYHRMAKEQGYRSRAAFKLKQLHDRFGFFSDARYILDLGAAPGGWLQVANEEAGGDALIIGIDLKKIKPLGVENVRTIVGDIMDDKTLELIRGIFPGFFDVIISDLSPNLSGIWEVDHLRQIYLARKTLSVAGAVLKTDGWVVVKVFQGSDYDKFFDEAKEQFSFVKVIKPRSSRKKSAEVYIVARGLKGSKRL